MDLRERAADYESPKVGPTKKAPAKTPVAAASTPPATTALIETKKPEEPPKAKPAIYVSEVHGPLVSTPRKPAKRSAKR
jgi:hypothetical protein